MRIRVKSIEAEGQPPFRGSAYGTTFDLREDEYQKFGPNGTGQVLRDTSALGIDATEAAIQQADRNRIDLKTISGTGAGGRIVVSDVDSAIEARRSALSRPSPSTQEQDRARGRTTSPARNDEASGGTTGAETSPAPDSKSSKGA